MSDFQFDEQSYSTPSHSSHTRGEKGIVGFLIKNGIAKDAKQANLVMIGMIVVCILILIALFATGDNGAKTRLTEDPSINPSTGLPRE